MKNFEHLRKTIDKQLDENIVKSLLCSLHAFLMVFKEHINLLLPRVGLTDERDRKRFKLFSLIQPSEEEVEAIRQTQFIDIKKTRDEYPYLCENTWDWVERGFDEHASMIYYAALIIDSLINKKDFLKALTLHHYMLKASSPGSREKLPEEMRALVETFVSFSGIFRCNVST